jgi:hypothetical protein
MRKRDFGGTVCKNRCSGGNRRNMKNLTSMGFVKPYHNVDQVLNSDRETKVQKLNQVDAMQRRVDLEFLHQKLLVVGNPQNHL